jgi:hypothetical protein
VAERAAPRGRVLDDLGSRHRLDVFLALLVDVRDQFVSALALVLGLWIVWRARRAWRRGIRTRATIVMAVVGGVITVIGLPTLVVAHNEASDRASFAWSIGCGAAKCQLSIGDRRSVAQRACA